MELQKNFLTQNDNQSKSNAYTCVRFGNLTKTLTQ